MANWGRMEPAAAEVWAPCDFQMAADWRMEPAAQVWVPDLPVDTHEMFGSCFQTSIVPSSSCGGQQQLVSFAAATEKAAAQDQFEVDIVKEMKVKIHENPIDVFKETSQVFNSGMEKMEMKIHKYPRSINAYVGTRHGVPSTVAIGPYWHGKSELQEAERVKHVAAYECIKESGHSVQDMYDAVVLDAGYARSLYDEDVVAKFNNDAFWPMMFYDACFLVQYMLTCTEDGLKEMDSLLRKYFDANDEAILNDIMMLENQIPWKVVETLMRFRPVPLDEVVTVLKGCLQDRKEGMPLVVLDNNYKPLHFLALMRFYIVGGRRDSTSKQSDAYTPQAESISISVSAVELEEIGIRLTAASKIDLVDMGIIKKGYIFQELSMPPLSLNDYRACILVNMAAFELCTVPNFQDADDEQCSAVCSYLQLLSMIVSREEDVQELRRKKVLQGGGGLTDKDALNFFTCLQDMRLGSRYIATMEKIEDYKLKRKMWVRVTISAYNNRKTIARVFGGVAALAGVLGTIISFKNG